MVVARRERVNDLKNSRRTRKTLFRKSVKRELDKWVGYRKEQTNIQSKTYCSSIYKAPYTTIFMYYICM